MTEKSLLLKCDFADHFFIVGTDFPTARVFDTTTSSLAAVVELPLRSRTISLAALTLTSVALRRSENSEEESKKGDGQEVRATAAAHARHSTEQLVDDNVAVYCAAVGLSNGTLLLHDVNRDVLLAHVQVSETQQPLISLQLCGGFVFCLAANSMLYAVRLRDAAAGPCLRLRVQPDASSIAATKVTKDSRSNDSSAAHHMYRVMVAGPTNALYEVGSLANNHSSGNTTPQLLHAKKCLAFPSQGTTAEFAWVSDVSEELDTPASLPAVTASAQDGVVRLWDLQYDRAASSPASLLGGATNTDAGAGGTGMLARCRRTLLCGQRILSVSVLPSANGHHNGTRKGNYIMVTTLTGSVLLWSLGEALLPPVVEPMPLKPDVVFVSAVSSGRLLFAALRAAAQQSAKEIFSSSSGASADALRGLEVTLLRGRFAMPIFETKNVGAAVEASSLSSAVAAATVATPASSTTAPSNTAHRTALATLALGVAGNTAITVVQLPLNTTSETALVERQDVDYLLERTTDAATSSFVVVDTVWAAHQQQVAAKASQSMTEAFKAPQLYHAKSIQDLPVKQLTLEQRLQQIAREEAAAARIRKTLAGKEGEVDQSNSSSNNVDGEGAGRSVLSHHALGLATIPLYQALHANDTAAVIDLLNMSSRTAEGMRATVLSLQLPYCLQLLQVISERLGLVSRAVEKAVSNPAAGGGNGQSVREANKADAQSNGSATTATATATAAGSADSNDSNLRADGVLRGGVATFSIRSSLLEWIDAMLNYRGSELLAVQRAWNARAARKAAGTSTPEDDMADTVSPPKDFLAPILHHYQDLCAQHDKLAVLYGRLSIFKAVRPSQKNAFTNVPRQSLGSNIEMARPVHASSDAALATSDPHKRRLHLAEKSSVVDSDIIFPVMFKESRARSGHRVVRVRSKLEIAKKRQERANKDAALQKRARALARQELHAKAAKGVHSILDDDDGHSTHKKGGADAMEQIMMEEMQRAGGELDLDALEAMDLAGDSNSDIDDSDAASAEEEEEEDSDVEAGSSRHRRRGKKARQEAVETMLADAGGADDEVSGGDADSGLDSSEAEFSSASDDEVQSDVLDDGSEEEDEEDESRSGEEGSDNDEAGSDYAGDDDDGSSGADDDGMGDDMRELLARHEDDADRTERRKAKKVRTD
ncbi:hypothetical protein ABB37_00929 [Leptomonas pyrrhocoris]|uniref:Uncharacterized protein n=1 Tax=Leptomonas pyrrhocoris TaxID=157538 RepID=A0A0N0E0W5_LEPPY|nr:hypothetical protein ABB37_00929 [Leptomonas pyrrhocoris]KPA86888.1 hypothetical protein ABB37_00929 [Leptomonas pyrrhocoris]|eukprot:XP_015665327.1 hypothetical protein ABB37_00929 [Leptomonas pyrrhocoris]